MGNERKMKGKLKDFIEKISFRSAAAEPRSRGQAEKLFFLKGFHRKNWFSERGRGAQIPEPAEKLVFLKGFHRKNWFWERGRGAQNRKPGEMKGNERK